VQEDSPPNAFVRTDRNITTVKDCDSDSLYCVTPKAKPKPVAVPVNLGAIVASIGGGGDVGVEPTRRSVREDRVSWSNGPVLRAGFRPTATPELGLEAARSLGDVLVAGTGPVGAAVELYEGRSISRDTELTGFGKAARVAEIAGPVTVGVAVGLLGKLRRLLGFADEVVEVGAKFVDDVAGAAATDAKFGGTVVARVATTIPEGQTVLAVVKDGKILAQSADQYISHSQFVTRTLGTVPEGAEVVTIFKSKGELLVFRSFTYHGNALPAAQSTFDTVLKFFQ